MATQAPLRRAGAIKIARFEETDTALLEIGGGTPAETRKLSEDVYVDLGETGHVVSITVEYASLRSDLSEVSFQRINKPNKKVLEAARWQL